MGARRPAVKPEYWYTTIRTRRGWIAVVRKRPARRNGTPGDLTFVMHETYPVQDRHGGRERAASIAEQVIEACRVSDERWARASETQRQAWRDATGVRLPEPEVQP